MSIEKTKEYMAIMQAYLDGKKIECTIHSGDDWTPMPNPSWNWHSASYRIAPSTPDSINWSHVSPEFKWMARDESGEAFLFTVNPHMKSTHWYAEDSFIPTSHFSSYVKGTCDWTESLVERPE